MPIVVDLLEWSKLFEDKNVIWWEDNAVALATMVRGGSDSTEVDRSAAVVSLASAYLRTVWLDLFVKKRTDGFSRVLFLDPFVKKHLFDVRQVPIPAWPWTVADDMLVKALKEKL